MKIHLVLQMRVKIGFAAITSLIASPKFQTRVLVTPLNSLECRECHSVYFTVAIENDEPVGFALAYQLQRIDRPHPMMFLYEIEVVGSHQRQGVATGF